MKNRLAIGALVVVSVVVPAACSSKKPNPPVAPTATPEAGALDDGGGLPMATGDAGFDLGDGGATAPIATGPVFFTDAGATPPSIPTSPEASDPAIDAAVAAAAAKVAPNMQPEGQPGRATLAQGEHFNMLITMQPNRCYTIIGFSPAGGVAQLDLKLLAPPLYNIESGKSAAGDKNQPVIGKGKAAMCPILPLPIAYKIDATAAKGAGRVGIHVYSRSK